MIQYKYLHKKGKSMYYKNYNLIIILIINSILQLFNNILQLFNNNKYI